MKDMGFRHHYGPSGPDGYYRAHGDEYRNPHEAAVHSALEHVVKCWTTPPTGVDLSQVLDLAAGSGEVTLALAKLVPGACVVGIDPYTARLYERRTACPCQPITFEQIATGEHRLDVYSCIVCSCALHLPAESWLPSLCQALALAARDLIVITPLTRPELRPEWGWHLQATTHCTAEQRSVRVRWYRSCWNLPQPTDLLTT